MFLVKYSTLVLNSGCCLKCFHVYTVIQYYYTRTLEKKTKQKPLKNISIYTRKQVFNLLLQKILKSKNCFSLNIFNRNRIHIKSFLSSNHINTFISYYVSCYGLNEVLLKLSAQGRASWLTSSCLPFPNKCPSFKLKQLFLEITSWSREVPMK